jgi:RNA polymerase subunit RPABC4/transcription elongation factor Spt4
MPLRSIGKGLGMGVGNAAGQELFNTLRGRNNANTQNVSNPPVAGYSGPGAIACACGFSNEPGKKFCNGCGAKLSAKPVGGTVYLCSCGTENSSDNKFCSECGSKVEPPLQRACTQCGTITENTNKFCNECGGKIDVVQDCVCGSCGVSMTPGAKFCNECGAKA